MNTSPIRRAIRGGCNFLILLILAYSLIGACPSAASPVEGTIVPGDIYSSITWNLDGSPYYIDSYVIIHEGATLTIEAGVEIDSLPPDPGPGPTSYNFDVYGTLAVYGTITDTVTFHNTTGGWSGISIHGTPESPNVGNYMEYAIVEGGGYQGSGTNGNLNINNGKVTVRHCQFLNSTGDGLLGGTGGEADIFDSHFEGNGGFAVYFEDGTVTPNLNNLTATGNGYTLDPYYMGNAVAINDATNNNHLILTDMGLPYVIWGLISGPDGTLDIRPGTHILAYPGNDSLDIYGNLIASGTLTEPIVMEPISPTQGWAGINILGTSEKQSMGFLDHVEIHKGGHVGGLCGIYVEYGFAEIKNSLIEGSGTDGVCLDYSASAIITGTQLLGNDGYPINVFRADDDFDLVNLTATGNITDAVGMWGGDLYGEHTWMDGGIGLYELYGSMTVATTATLTIDPGLIVQTQVSNGFEVRGTLLAEGTEEQPILFTGTPEISGTWGGLGFYGMPGMDLSVGRFEYATIEYAGYGGWPAVSVTNGNVTFDHCNLRENAGDGIKYLGTVSSTLDTDGSILAGPGLRVKRSQFTNLGGYAVNNIVPGSPVWLTYNWWGAPSGPAAPDNPDGLGEPITADVVYRPYLKSPKGNIVFLPSVIR